MLLQLCLQFDGDLFVKARSAAAAGIQEILDGAETAAPGIAGCLEEGAGFIAVLSDAYASRYWCRREVEAARTPRIAPERSVGGSASAHVWSVCPSVVALTMRGE